jgi:hypothetical protein
MHINSQTLTKIDDALVAARFDEQTQEAMDAALEDLRSVRDNTATDEQLDAARKLYRSNEIEIDDDAAISQADDGYWVQAWVWVPVENEDEVDD